MRGESYEARWWTIGLGELFLATAAWWVLPALLAGAAATLYSRFSQTRPLAPQGATHGGAPPARAHGRGGTAGNQFNLWIRTGAQP